MVTHCEKFASLEVYRKKSLPFNVASTEHIFQVWNVEYEIRRWAALFVTVNNVFNVAPTSLRYGSQTPGYARQFRTQEYGIQFNIGVKGSF